MELGQAICAPAAPRCTDCPLADLCAARASGRAGELPVVARRPRDGDKPLLAAHAVWLERGGRVLLARRRPHGLFGGLWELPQAPDRERLQALFAELGATLDLDSAPIFRHRQALSHRRLAIDLHVGRLEGRFPRRAFTAAGTPYERIAWHSLGTLGSLGVAASSRAIIRRHQELDGWTSGRSPSGSSRRATRRSSTA
jgi:A/G-specific adenine glycosylase